MVFMLLLFYLGFGLFFNPDAHLNHPLPVEVKGLSMYTPKRPISCPVANFYVRFVGRVK